MRADPRQRFSPRLAHIGNLTDFNQLTRFRAIRARVAVMCAKRIHLVKGGGGAIVIAHAQFQAQIAADEKERVEAPVVAPTPGQAGEQYPQRYHAHECPRARAFLPPQFKEHTAQDHWQKSRLHMESRTSRQS